MLLNFACKNFVPEAPDFPQDAESWRFGYRAKSFASTLPILAGGIIDTLLVIPAIALNALTFGRTETFLDSTAESPKNTLPAVVFQLLKTINPEAESPGTKCIEKGGYAYRLTAKYFIEMNDEAAGSESKWTYHVASRAAAVAAAVLGVVACAADAAIAAVTVPMVLVRGGRDEKIADIAFRSLTFPNMATLVVNCAMQFIYPRELYKE